MRIVRRLAAGLGLLVLLALVLEVVFRLGGAWVASTPAPSADGSMVVLCVGDSHTRGRPDPDNYPAALERLLNERTGRRWRVVNLGVPGQNTGQIRARLERYIAYYRPVAVLHWAGINNYWNVAERDGSPGDVLDRLLDRSRLARFVRVAAFYRGLRADGEEGEMRALDLGKPTNRVEVNFADTPDVIHRPRGRLPVEQVGTYTHDDLTVMMKTARRNGVPLYFVAYAFWGENFTAVNRAVREVSAAFGVPFIDSSDAVHAAAKAFPGEKLFDAWVHPMPVVYREVGALAYRLLEAQGVLGATRSDGQREAPSARATAAAIASAPGADR